MITYNGRILNFTSKSDNQRLNDYQAPYSYCGIAPKNANTSDSVWTIFRIEVYLNGGTNTLSATSVKWDDRYLIIYT
jgi:hypothetical protein